MTGTIFTHEVERIPWSDDARYECVDCGLSSDEVATFEQHECDTPYDEAAKAGQAP